MQKKNFFNCCTVSLLFLLSCRTPTQNPIVAEWYQTTESFVPWVSNTDNMMLRLYPKGQYTQYGTNSYSFGRWRYNEKGAYLHLHQETGTATYTDEYLKIDLLENKRLIGGMFSRMPFQSNRQQTFYRFRGQLNRSDADPYSTENNEWRLQPALAETDAAIKKRVTAYLHFLQAMYQHAMDNKLERMNDYWYPSPLRMFYGNGVRMAYSNELDDWNRCFYDSAQAVKGYQLISGQLYGIKLKAGVPQRERNLDCVEQLLKAIQ